jgi:hypothetical protein
VVDIEQTHILRQSGIRKNDLRRLPWAARQWRGHTACIVDNLLSIIRFVHHAPRRRSVLQCIGLKLRQQAETLISVASRLEIASYRQAPRFRHFLTDAMVSPTDVAWLRG